MNELKFKIVAFVDEWQPGWVKCSFSDIYGSLHFFDEKLSVVTTEWLDANNEYPQGPAISTTLQIIKAGTGTDNATALPVNRS